MIDDDDNDKPNWFFGTDPRYLHRTEGPHTSVAAAYSVDTAGKERLVFEAICSYGDAGCIQDTLLLDYPRLPYSSLTARPSALEEKGLIVRGPDTRPGRSGKQQKVMRKSPLADFLLRKSKS